MEFYVDSSDLEAVKAVASYYPIDGVTTNPNILTQTGKPVSQVLAGLRDYVRAENQKIFVQVTARGAEEMFRQAQKCQAYFGENLIVKIPAVKEGFRAIRLCTSTGIPVLCTVIHSLTQALLAAKAGAQYVAPYVSHIDNIGADGIETVREMVTAFRDSGYACKVLAASFRNADQIRRLMLVGCQAVTLPPSFFDLLIHHPSTDESMAGFYEIWERNFGKREITDFLTGG